jgi:hypothetical protein
VQNISPAYGERIADMEDYYQIIVCAAQQMGNPDPSFKKIVEFLDGFTQRKHLEKINLPKLKVAWREFRKVKTRRWIFAKG